MGEGDLEKALGHRFGKPELLLAALTHKSHAAERRSGPYNERLEFLGDSVLALVVAGELYARNPDVTEGELSKLKSVLVARPSLARWARELELGKHLLLGAGEDASGGRARPSILSNAMEAVLGAMYLDGGLEPPARLIRGWLERQQPRPQENDPKSLLQELMQKRHKSPPEYDLERASGPDHDKTFQVTVRLGRKALGRGTGKSKKEAEQDAARDALARLETDR